MYYERKSGRRENNPSDLAIPSRKCDIIQPLWAEFSFPKDWLYSLSSPTVCHLYFTGPLTNKHIRTALASPLSVCIYLLHLEESSTQVSLVSQFCFLTSMVVQQQILPVVSCIHWVENHSHLHTLANIKWPKLRSHWKRPAIIGYCFRNWQRKSKLLTRPNNKYCKV